ncbi:MAG TPA: ChaN family lipoprotein, partial [Polyangia bacterium]
KPQTAPVVPLMNRPFGDPARRDREASLVLDAITDTRTGNVLSVDQFAKRLADTRLVFFGESHTHPEVHAAQALLLEALAVTGRPVVVALEMFPRDDGVDAALARWTAGAGDESSFLADSRWYEHWGYHFGYYRDVFEVARRRKLPLHGVNIPREVITAVRKKGFEGLTSAEKAHLPAPVEIDNDEHRRLFRAHFENAAGSAHAEMSEEAWAGMFRAQCTWDAVMGWNAVRLLEKQTAPDAIVVVLIGSGHVAFDLGATRQIASAARAATLIALPILDEDGQPSRARASYADYLWAQPPEPTLPPFPTLGISLSSSPGAAHPTVVMVMPESAAAVAGIAPGDLVVAVEDHPVGDKATFSRLMADKRWGQTVKVTVRRGDKTHALSAPLRRKWEDPSASKD